VACGAVVVLLGKAACPSASPGDFSWRSRHTTFTSRWERHLLSCVSLVFWLLSRMGSDSGSPLIGKRPANTKKRAPRGEGPICLGSLVV